MKKTIILAYAALFITIFLPYAVQMRHGGPVREQTQILENTEKITQSGEKEQPRSTPKPEITDEPKTEAPEETAAEPASEGAEDKKTAETEQESAPKIIKAENPAPEKITVLVGDAPVEMDMQEYLIGVVAAEMPAGFAPEALKAQAVAARSYALYCAGSDKHGNAQVCTDFNCCQAWISQEDMRENWGEAFEENYKKISSAVNETAGQYLSYEGQPVFAAFHSSSAGATEDCGNVWNSRPYLVSVESPESETNVPNFISTLECAPIDFRDCVLSLKPEADFTGSEETWIGETERDDSGRVSYIILGNVKIKGTEIRELFSLRSTYFELQYIDGKFLFTVKGFGHGVGMSQYGAKLMAERGESYTEILAHYYPGTVLTA